MTQKPDYIVHEVSEKDITVDWFFGPGHWGTKLGQAALLVVALVVPGGTATGVTTWRNAFDQAEFRSFLIDGDHPGDLALWLLGPFDVTIPTVD